jgi:hypothetical protein
LARWVDLSNQADDQDRVNGLLKDAEKELNKTREKG